MQKTIYFKTEDEKMVRILSEKLEVSQSEVIRLAIKSLYEKEIN